MLQALTAFLFLRITVCYTRCGCY